MISFFQSCLWHGTDIKEGFDSASVFIGQVQSQGIELVEIDIIF